MKQWTALFCLLLLIGSAKANANCDTLQQMAEAGLVSEIARYPLKPGVSSLDETCLAAAMTTAKRVKASRLIDEASAYLKLDDRAAARERLQEALSLTPDDPTIAAILEQAQPTKEHTQLSTRLSNISKEIDTTAIFAAKYLLLLVVGLTAIPALLSWTLNRRDSELDIGTFDVRGFGDRVSGDALVDTLLHRYQTLTQSDIARNVDLVVAPSEPTKIATDINRVLGHHPTSGATGALASLVINIYQALRLRTIYTLTGEFHNVKGRGVGVTTRLIRNRRVVASETLWVRDFQYGSQPDHYDDVSQSYRLTEYLATWLQFNVSRIENTRSSQILQTDNWKSYALFLASQYAYLHGRRDEAVVLAERSLVLDPRFHAVRANIARMTINRPGDDPAAKDRAKLTAHRHFETIRAACREEKLAQERPPVYRDTVYYTALYGLAYLASVGDQQGKIERIESYRREFDAALDLAGYRGHVGLNQRQLQKIATIHHAVRAIQSVTLAKSDSVDQRSEAWRIAEEERQVSGTSPSHEYNLACTYSILSKSEEFGERAKELATCAMALLRSSLLREPNLIANTLEDTDFNAIKISNAVEFDEIIAIARTTAGRDKPEAAPRADLKNFIRIGEYLAKELAKQGIRDASELLNKGRFRAGRLALATALNISHDGVIQMLQQVALSRIAGLEVKHANALDLSGVGSIDALADAHARALASKLDDIPEHIRGPTIPLTLVERWIEDAKTLETSGIELS